jgi:serine/threonine protein kinase
MSASSLQPVTTSTTSILSYTLIRERTLIGKVLGNRYRVLREIGSGGMAWVYLAEDTKESQLVAVKILYPQFGQDLAYIQRFNREAKLASTLTDPHIVKVLDYGADRDIYYLVMEYIEGKDLRTTLNEKGPFSWKNALEVIDQLATALEHAHQHGVVHRDIKPQNIMLTEDGLLKVLDFGIARIPTLPSLTQSGFIGSPYYVSPEQAMGEEVDTRSDIYSAGIVLYELLSGSIPFDSRSPWSIISQHIASDPPPIELPKGDIPDNVHDLLTRMVAKKPRERFQTPTSLRQAIAAVLAGQSIPDHTLDTQPLPPPDPTLLANSLFKRAMEAIEAKEWARAADLLSQTLKLNPAHPDAADLLAQAEQEAFLVSLYNAAKRAAKNNYWEEAITNLTGIIEIEVGYRDAAKLLAEAQQTLEIENGRQLVSTRYNEGLAHFEAGRWGNAIEAFQEVKRILPGYQRVEQMLMKAESAYRSTGQKQTQLPLKTTQSNLLWRWALAALGSLIILAIIFRPNLANLAAGSPTSQATQTLDPKNKLKTLYEQAQKAIEQGDKQQAIAFLDQILKEDPDYANVANLRRELAVTPTPIPTTTPSPTATPTIAPTPTSVEDSLAKTLGQVEQAIDSGQWADALKKLNLVRSANPDYQPARLATLFCDAYVGRGQEVVANLGATKKKETIASALADFIAGAKECPRRTDLQDQSERAAAYLKALETTLDDYDTLIQTLAPLVAAEPDYAAGDAKNQLYAAYLKRGDARRQATEIVGALSDYEAALALNVADPSVGQTRRAELLLSFNQQAAQPTPEATPAPAVTVVGTQTPTPEPVAVKYDEPELISPADDALFAGKLTDVYLEWSASDQLAEDEYYDVTIQYIYGNEFVYWGAPTRETRIKIPPDIGVGRAGGDRFRWYVTVRKANTAALSKNNLDLPVSLQSKIRTFVWVP